jgi:FdrA protein
MIGKLLASQIRVINIGLEGFARDLKNKSVPVVHVDWSPPAGGNARMRDLLSKLNS